MRNYAAEQKSKGESRFASAEGWCAPVRDIFCPSRERKLQLDVTGFMADRCYDIEHHVVPRDPRVIAAQRGKTSTTVSVYHQMRITLNESYLLDQVRPPRLAPAPGRRLSGGVAPCGVRPGRRADGVPPLRAPPQLAAGPALRRGPPPLLPEDPEGLHAEREGARAAHPADRLWTPAALERTSDRVGPNRGPSFQASDWDSQ